MDTTIYTLKEFAEKIKVSTRTLVRWHESSKFTAKINPSGKMFYTKVDFEKYIGVDEKITLSAEDALALIAALENKEPISEDVVSRWKVAGERYKKMIK